jgi:hypothetical protein
LIANKFKPLIFSMSGFTLSYTANMFILMILYNFCLLPVQFCYIVAYIRKVESRVQIADRCTQKTPLPAVLLLLGDVNIRADRTEDTIHVACAIVVTLISFLLCRNLVTTMSSD